MSLVEVVVFTDEEGDRRPEVFLAGVLFQTGADRVTFSDIDGGEATGLGN